MPSSRVSKHYRSKSYQDAQAEQDLRNQLKIEIDPDQPINFESYGHNQVGSWSKTEAKVKSFFEQHPRFTKFVRQHPSTIDTLELAGNLGNLDEVTDILQNPSHAVYYQPQRLGLKAIEYTGAKLVGKFGVFEQRTQTLSQIENLSSAESRNLAAVNIIEARKILRDAGVSLTKQLEIIKSFDLETFRIQTTDTEITVYRYFDDSKSKLTGRYLTPELISSQTERISKLALMDNSATRIGIATVPKGVKLFAGVVAPQLDFTPGLIGGYQQTFFTGSFDQLKFQEIYIKEALKYAK